MNIGLASDQSGLPAKTIRYYEDIELVTPARNSNGYRNYSQADVHKLSFIHRSRNLGFSVEDCRQLLTLYEDKARESADVKLIAKKRLDDINRKISELTQLRNTLMHLVKNCNGDDRPDCPILENLSEELN